MQTLDLHDRSQRVFADVLSRVQPDQLGNPTPCTEWTVRDLIDHVISANNSVADRCGDPVEGDLVAAHAVSVARAREVFAASDGMTRIHKLPIGEIPGAQFLKMRITDVLLHSWDLAKATGQDTDLDPELATAVWPMAHELIQPAFRGPGRPFGPPQPCPDARSAADQLAAFCGRSVE